MIRSGRPPDWSDLRKVLCNYAVDTESDNIIFINEELLIIYMHH